MHISEYKFQSKYTKVGTVYRGEEDVTALLPPGFMQEVKKSNKHEINLAVLIAYQLTAKSQVGVDYRGQNTVKSVQNEKYSAKSADFLRFLLYLCHVIDDFACLELQH